VDTSLLLFVVAAGCGLLFAVLAVYAQAGRSGLRGVRWRTPAVILVLCAAFGCLAFVLDSGNAATTLYEIDAQGPGDAVPDATEYDFVVEHPGAVHDLLVDPRGAPVDHPLDVRVELRDPNGAVALDEAQTLDPRCDQSTVGCTWDSWSRTFVPPVAGPYRMVVTIGARGVDDVHVRVGDPQKTDGHRAPGY
jgi:hypothetical protein